MRQNALDYFALQRGAVGIQRLIQAKRAREFNDIGQPFMQKRLALTRIK